MEPFGGRAWVAATVMASWLAGRAYRNKNLSYSGTVAGFIVAFLLVATGWRGLNLFYFYQVGSWATRYQAAYKAQRDATAQQSSVRGARQVLAVSLLAVLLSLWHARQLGAEKPFDFDRYPLASRIAAAVLAHHATSLGDTLASELGILAQSPPVLILRPWQTVPPGTNGGVTAGGTFWSAAGGALLGFLTVLTDLASGNTPVPAVALVTFGAAAGLLGSLLDSILGATCQATYYDVVDTKLVYHADTADRPRQAQHITGRNWLTNEQVNLVSVALTTWIGGWILGPALFAAFPTTLSSSSSSGP